MKCAPTPEAICAYEAKIVSSLRWISNDVIIYSWKKGSAPGSIEMRNVQTGTITPVCFGSKVTVSGERQRILFERSKSCIVRELETGAETTLPDFPESRAISELQ